MTHRRTVSTWLVLSALGVMTWTAAGCSSGTPSADPAVPVTSSAAISDPANTRIPAPAPVVAATEIVDTSGPQELPPIVEATDPAAKNIEGALDATVEKAVSEVEDAHDGGEARAPAGNSPPTDAANLAKEMVGNTVRRASGKVKQSVAQTAGEFTQGIEQEIKQTAGQLEQNARARVQNITNGIAKSIDAKANGMKNAAKGAMDKGLDKAKSEVLKAIGETPKPSTP